MMMMNKVVASIRDRPRIVGRQLRYIKCIRESTMRQNVDL